MAGQGIELYVYRQDDPTALIDIIPRRMDPGTLEELSSVGAGSFFISKSDPTLVRNPTILDYYNVVEVRVDGKAVNAFLINTKKSVLLDAEGDPGYAISGEGLRYWLHFATVHPKTGIVLTSKDTRFFNFASEVGSWYNAVSWTTPVVVANYEMTPVAGSTSPWAYAPANWPDAPGAKWVWGNNSASPAAGDNFFRYEFTTTRPAPHTIFAAADDLFEAYLDGELVITSEAGTSWQEVWQYEQQLEPGAHVMAFKVRNNGGRAGLIAALYQSGNAATNTPADLIATTGGAGWKVAAYPAVAPAWTPGEILLTLLSEAQARGVRFPGWITPSFTASHDSYGVPWKREHDWSFDTGTEYFNVLDQIEALGFEAWIDPKTLVFHLAPTRGTDRSVPIGVKDAIVLKEGKNLTKAETLGQANIKNALTMQTAEGWTQSPKDTASVSKYGVIEGSVSADTTLVVANKIASETLKLAAIPEEGATYALIAVPGAVPFVDFFVGDWVLAPNDEGKNVKRRVVSISASEGEAGEPTYAIEFDTIFRDMTDRFERFVTKSEQGGLGASIPGTGPVSGGGGTPAPPTTSPSAPGTNAKTPVAPTGLSVTSTSSWLPDGGFTSTARLTWSPVTQYTDGSASSSVKYEVYRRLATTEGSTFEPVTAVSVPEAVLPGFARGSSWSFKVVAIASGRTSADSATVTKLMDGELQLLPAPTKPEATSKLGAVSVSWDGKLLPTVNPPAHFVHVYVVHSLTENGVYTPIGQTLGRAGQAVIPGLTMGTTYFFKLIAVDAAGQSSPASAPTSVLVQSVLAEELEQDIKDAIDEAIDKGDAAASKGKIIYGSTTPVAADRLPQNMWIDTTVIDGKPGNVSKRWNGTDWVPVMAAALDKAAADAAAAAGSATAAQGAATSAQTAATNAVTKADAAQALADATSNTLAGVPALIATAKAQAEDAAALTAQAKADQAKADATSAAATDAKNKADAAKADAITAAATAAQTLANAAEKAAKEAAALDATTKANAAQEAAIAAAADAALTIAQREAKEAEDAAKAYVDLQAGGSSDEVLAEAKAYADQQAAEAQAAAIEAAAITAQQKATAAENAAKTAAATDAKNKADAAEKAAKEAAATDATTKANAAEKAAKDAAALDATSKANAAQSAASSAAALDATNKANAALAAANLAATEMASRSGTTIFSTLDPSGKGNNGDMWAKRDANGGIIQRWEWRGAGVPHTAVSNLKTKNAFGADAEITNLATNPSFERSIGLTSLRTNLVPDAMMVTGANIHLYGGSVKAQVTVPNNEYGTSATQVTRTAAGTGLMAMVYSIPIGFNSPASGKVVVRRKPGSADGLILNMSAIAYIGGSGTQWGTIGTPGRTVTLTDSWVELDFSGFVSSSTQTAIGLQLVAVNPWGAADGFEVSAALVEATPVSGPIFSGATITTNLSRNPRAISGAGAGWSANNGAVHDQQWITTGVPPHPQGLTTALRGNIKASAVPATAALSIYNLDGLANSEAAPERTHGLWVYSEQPGYRVSAGNGFDAQDLPARTWVFVRSTVSIKPGQYSGFAVTRITGMADPTHYVYVTGLVTEAGPAVVSGGFYDKDMQDTTYFWSGAPNASSSLQRTPAPFGAGAGNGTSVVSSMWSSTGKTSLRIVPSSTSNASTVIIGQGTGAVASASAQVVIEPGKTYTLLAKRFLPVPLTGTLNGSYAGRAAFITANGGTFLSANILPNVAGIAELRFTFTVPQDPGAWTLRLGHGGAMGSGEVWWDDFGVVEGEYTGPYFDGDSRGAWWGAGSWATLTDKDVEAALQYDTNTINPVFSKWTTAHPLGYATWSGTLATKETTIVRTGPHAVRFKTSATANSGLAITPALNPDMPNFEYVNVTVEFYLVSGSLTGAGVVLDWNGMTVSNREQLYLAAEIPNVVTGRWYRVSKVLRRPAAAAGTYTDMGGFLMANYGTFGGLAVKDIIFGRLSLRAATSEEISALRAEVAATEAGQIAAGAAKAAGQAQTAAEGKNAVWYLATAPAGTTHKINDLWFDTANDNRPNRWTGAAWVAAQLGDKAIAYIDAGTISVGTLAAGRIATKSITADKVVITSTDNLLLEPDFNNFLKSWLLNTGMSHDPTGSRNGSGALKIVNNATQQAAYNSPFEAITVEEGSVYRLSLWFKSSVEVPVSGVMIGTRVRLMDGSYVFPSVNSIPARNTAVVPADTWSQVTGTALIPANAVTMSVYIASQGNHAAGAVWFDAPSVTRAASANLIVDGAVTAKSLAVDSVTAVSIKAGEVQLQHLAAKSIDASKMLIADLENYLENPYFTEALTVGWTVGGNTVGWSIQTATDTAIDRHLQRSGTAATASGQVLNNYRVPVTAGEKFLITARVNLAGNAVGTVGVQYFAANGALLSDEFLLLGNTVGWVSVERLVTVPASAYFVRLRVTDNGVSGSTFRIATIRFRRMNAGELIVDGGIKSKSIATGAIIADKIEVGAVETKHIKTSAITTELLAADAITAKHTITGALIRTAASGARTELTNAGLRTTDASGNDLVRIGYGIATGMSVKNPAGNGALVPLGPQIFGTVGVTQPAPFRMTGAWQDEWQNATVSSPSGRVLVMVTVACDASTSQNYNSQAIADLMLTKDHTAAYIRVPAFGFGSGPATSMRVLNVTPNHVYHLRMSFMATPAYGGVGPANVTERTMIAMPI